MPSFVAIAAVSLLELLGLAPKPTTPAAPVAPAQALVASPASAPIKGTMLMVHGGGWTGPGPASQKHLMEQPGELLVRRGWRVVSVDYRAGTDGIDDVLARAGEELGRPEGGLLCIYGESAGAQIALVVASRLPAVDCVVAAGAPTDFQAYIGEARSSGNGLRAIIADQMESVFGTSGDATAPFEPVRLAGRIAADVLMLREADDHLMPRDQLDAFLAARPTTESLELESSPTTSADSWWLHGTLSDAGRARYAAAVGGFADRADAAHRAERAAARTGCGRVTRSGRTALAAALRCLARRDRTLPRARGARAATTTRRLRGELNAARVWAALRASASGRRALAALAARRATVDLRPGDPTVVTLRGR